MGIKREFTEEKRQELYGYVDKHTESDDPFLRSIGDFFCDLFTFVNINDHLESISTYHDLIVDDKDITKAQIDKVWADTNAVDVEREKTLAGMKTELEELANDIAALNDALNPDGPDGKGNYLSRSTAELRDYLNANLGEIDYEHDLDHKMQDRLFELLQSDEFSQAAWDAAAADDADFSKRRAFLDAFFEQVQRIMGTDAVAQIRYFFEEPNADGNLRLGNYSPRTNDIGINEFIFDHRTDIYHELTTLIIHETRHSYQWESIVNYDPNDDSSLDYETHIVDDDTRNSWYENWLVSGNYRNGNQDSDETSRGITDDPNLVAYRQQPIEWDAHSFARQDDVLRGLTPVYPGSWGS